MENNTPVNPAFTPQMDSNAEYISAKGVHDQPPIITSVFKSIFVETPKDFFASIKNFFLRFVNLFKDGFKYLKYPSLKIDPFATKDYKENCQYTFEYVLLVIALLIFLIKLDWIFGEEELLKVYNNDISQAIMQFMIFVIFAVAYFILIIVTVLIGRLFRVVFKLPVTRHESDILFTYLNNIIFLITSSLAFFLRCIVPFRNVEGQENTVAVVMLSSYALIYGIMIYRWSKRFSLLNNLSRGKSTSFQVSVTLIATALFAFCSMMFTSFIWGV